MELAQKTNHLLYALCGLKKQTTFLYALYGLKTKNKPPSICLIWFKKQKTNHLLYAIYS